MRFLRRALTALAGGALYSILTVTVASAVLGASTSAAMSVTSKRIFPTSQATSAWDIGDASAGGTEASATDPMAAVDARLFTTAALTTAFSSTRYVQLTMSSPLPTATPVASVALNLTMAASGGGTACVYVEIRRNSTNALLGTQGSSTTPLACSSSTTQTTTTSNLTYVTSSTDADDLRVKIFARNSSSQKIAFDRVSVSGTMYSSPFTLFETTNVNSSSGTATTTPWSLATADTTTYAPASAWATAFSPARYLDFTFPAEVPTGAAITDVNVQLAFASATSGQSSCVWIEVYNGATLVDSFGTTATPFVCRTTTTQTTDSIDLSHVDTVSEANNVLVRVYVRNASSGQTRHGLATLTVDYALT